MNADDFAQYLKKKGFVYQSSDIYGGLSGVYDYGHMGTLIKQKWCDLWRKFFLRLHEDFVEIDTALIMHEDVFRASGHLENFFDPIAIGEKGKTARADHLVEEHAKVKSEGLSTDELFEYIQKNNLTIDGEKIVKVENLNMMFPIAMGPSKGIKAYLRPETAQSPYVNFRLQHELMRKKIPMGLALIGRVYRNEISPRNLLLRTREIEQAELQIFFNPSKIDEHENFEEMADYEIHVERANSRGEIKKVKIKDLGLPKFYAYHLAKVQQFYFEKMHISPENFRLLELNEDEKAFYNKYHFDVEIKFDTTNSWVEVAGVHYRTDHDLAGHQKVSGVKMEIIDETTKEKFIPHVLELSFGVGRSIYTLLDQNLQLEDERGNALLALPNSLAPYTAAVFPLVNKEGLLTMGRKIREQLLDADLSIMFDKSGSVGRRYARADELGIPFCLTVDFDSLDDNCVTVRDRNTTKQERIPIKELETYIKSKL